MEYNIYCDESCHLPNDKEPVMVLGAIWCPKAEARRIAENVRAIKVRHGLPPFFEIKWSKVYTGKEKLYLDLINYFFNEKDLHFRGLIAEKTGLNHEKYNQSHDDWYFKMYYQLLSILFLLENAYYIYLDIKDTRSLEKVQRLHQIICNSQHDFDRNIIKRIQLVRSHEMEQIQIADIIIGAIGYLNRNKSTSNAKNNIVKEIKILSGLDLISKTDKTEQKFNLFHWKPIPGDR